MTAPVTTHIADAILDVARCRRQAADAQAVIAELDEEFSRTNDTQIQAFRDAKEAVNQAERIARELSLVHYTTTGNKKPTAGVEIKLGRKYVYTEGDALAWARKTGMALVPETFDRKALEKVASATPLDFVTYEETPTATLASDLEKALAVAEVTS